MPRGLPPLLSTAEQPSLSLRAARTPDRAGAHSRKGKGPSEALGLCPACPRLLMACPGMGTPLGPHVEGHRLGGGDETGP